MCVCFAVAGFVVVVVVVVVLFVCLSVCCFGVNTRKTDPTDWARQDVVNVDRFLHSILLRSRADSQRSCRM